MEDQNRDFNKLVEDLGEESARVEQLRKQHMEREEKQQRSKKRLHQQIVEKKQKEVEELDLITKRLKTDGQPSVTSINNNGVEVNVSGIYE